MDNNGKIYSLLDQASFNQWLQEFFNKKSNELNYSNTNQPKRVEKITIKLDTAEYLGRKISIPFKSCFVRRFYNYTNNYLLYAVIALAGLIIWKGKLLK